MKKLCWWCCHDIPGDVFEYPYKYEKDTFYLCGQFCGWPCVKAYNIHANKVTYGRCSDLISLYRLKTTGKLESIKTAPSRYSLESFGGTLTIDQFRSGSMNVCVRLPCENFIKLHNSVSIQTDVISKDDDLVLRRNKPLKRDMNGIQKLLLKK